MAQPKNQQLPQEIVTPVKSKEFLLSLLGTFIFIILFNFAAKLYLKENTTNRAYWLINEKWELLLNQKKPVDWLILGDSSCNQGVVPSIVDEKLNVNSINLCTIGDMLTLDDAWMLEKYIQRFGVPKNVLIVHVHDAWSREVNRSLLAKIPLNWGYWQQLEPRVDLGLKDTAQLFVDSIHPTLFGKQKPFRIIKVSLRYV